MKVAPSPAAAGTDIGTLHPGQLPCFTDDADGAASPWPLSVAGYGAYGARFTVLSVGSAGATIRHETGSSYTVAFDCFAYCTEVRP